MDSDSLVSGHHAGSSWSERFFIVASSPLFTHPPYLVTFLIATLIPFALLVEGYGKKPAMAVKQTATKPEGPTGDFKGDIKVDNTPPKKETLKKIANLPVLDKDKESHSFKSLYADNENGPRRVLVIFVRHFFCGNCQEYIRTLGSSLTKDALSSIQPPTEVVIIGCGQPELISMYIENTGCPYPIYADPTRKLYDILGMTKTLSLGNKAPEYMQKSLFSMVFRSFLQELRAGRNMLSGGDFWQVGGEFMFENGEVTWCHRMRNTRDHAEISELRERLGLDGEKPPVRTTRRTSGLGAGLAKRLSERRQSWSGSRSRSRTGKESPTRSALDKLKEEGGEEKTNGHGVDAAYAKLTTGGSDGTANGASDRHGDGVVGRV